MSASARMERGYRRLLGCYPREFRRENGEEMLAVLMDGAAPGQRRPSVAERVDLICGAIRTHLTPGRSDSRARVVRLMYLGAVIELAALATILVTASDVRSAVTAHNAALTMMQTHALGVALTAEAIAAATAVLLWLVVAWGTSHGYGWATAVFMVFVALSLVGSVAGGAISDASADVVAGIALAILELTIVALILAQEARRENTATAVLTPNRSDNMQEPGQS